MLFLKAVRSKGAFVKLVDTIQTVAYQPAARSHRIYLELTFIIAIARKEAELVSSHAFAALEYMVDTLASSCRSSS
jgi:hypothetical protein